MRFLFSAVLFVLGFTAPALWAQGSSATDASISFKGSYHDLYLFRGHVFNNDPVILGEAIVGFSNWSYNLLFAEPAEIRGPLERELSHTLNYTTISRGRVTTMGYSFFDYEGSLPETQEIFFRVAHTGRWHTSYGLAYDFDAYKGYYADGSITRFWPFSRGSSLVFNLSGGLSYQMDEERNEQNLITEPGFFGEDGLNHASALLKWVWQPLQWLKLETGVQYHYALDELLYGGLGLERGQTVWRSSLTISLP